MISHPDDTAAHGNATHAMASAVDLLPTLLEMAGEPVRDGVLTATESITTLDAGFWRRFDVPDAVEQMMDERLRPDWTKRGLLRGYTDERYSFGRYFAPLEPNRPGSIEELHARNDVVLHDRVSDPDEVINLAADPANAELVELYRGRLESMITAEVGADDEPWVTERPHLLGPMRFHGD